MTVTHENTLLTGCPVKRVHITFKGFNSSFFLMQNALRLIGNLNYNLTMISDKLGISTTQLNKYIDSYITIPPRPLPDCLGIDELHSHELSRRNSIYLFMLVDNEGRTIWDVLDSRIKMTLSLFFSNIPREEHLRVKYVTIDMWETYKDVARTYFHNCVLIWRYLEEILILIASEIELSIRFLKMFNIR